MPDQVRLAMPADPEFLRLARVTAMGIASRLGFTLDEIEDLRIATDEMCHALIGHRGRAGTVELHYTALAGGIEVVGRETTSGARPTNGLSEMSRLVLAAVTDEHELAVGGESASFRFVKRKASP